MTFAGDIFFGSNVAAQQEASDRPPRAFSSTALHSQHFQAPLLSAPVVTEQQFELLSEILWQRYHLTVGCLSVYIIGTPDLNS